MGVRWQAVTGKWVGIAAVTSFAATTVGLMPLGQAQPNPSQPMVMVESIPEAFDRMLTLNSTDFFTNRSPRRQIDLIFGFGSFTQDSYPENEIVRDARAVHQLYEEVLEQQTTSDPTLRTPDLNNPFDTSLLTLPSSRANNRLVGSELVFERVANP